jgi:hypothetical protein
VRLDPRVWVFLAIVWLGVWAQRGWAQEDAGAIERVSGTVNITAADGQSRPARVKELVRSGDTVATEAASELLIKLRDNTSLAVRPNTQVRIVEFQYRQQADDLWSMRVLKGSLRAITGLIAKSRPSANSISSITATIGIRGTDLEVAVVPEGSSEGRAGTYNLVRDGETEMQVATGETLAVRRDQTGFAAERLEPGEPALQLLQAMPAFLRGGGFDALMLQLGSQPRLPPLIRPLGK